MQSRDRGLALPEVTYYEASILKQCDIAHEWTDPWKRRENTEIDLIKYRNVECSEGGISK